MSGFVNGGTMPPDTGVAVMPWENPDWWTLPKWQGYPEKEL